MNQIGNNKLKKNFNNWAILSLINNTKVNEKPIVGWKIIAGKKVTVSVVFHIIRKVRNELVVRAIGQQAKAVLADLSVGAQNLNFYLPEDLVLFQTEVKQIDSNGDVIIKIPKMIAQLDRRKHMRLFIEDGMRAGVLFKKDIVGQKVMTQLFDKTCFDISAGGFSFIISRPESKFFQVGDNVPRIKVLVENKKMLAEGKVISLLEVEPTTANGLIYKGWKVCVKFTKIHPENMKRIDEFVFKFVALDDAV